MRRRILTIAIAAAAAGCSDNRSSVEILGRAAPDNIPTCKFAAGGLFLAGPGQLDVTTAAVRTYDAFLYVNNKMVDPSKANDQTIASSKSWRALAAKIRVNPSDYLTKFPPAPDLLSFSGDNRLPLDGTTIPVDTDGIQYVNVISQSMGTSLFNALGGATSGTVVVGVTLEGETLDGVGLDSGEWFFTLKVCTGAGCLYPICVAPDVVTGCFPGFQDPFACVTP